MPSRWPMLKLRGSIWYYRRSVPLKKARTGARCISIAPTKRQDDKIALGTALESD
jgi:hypothetical protein